MRYAPIVVALLFVACATIPPPLRRDAVSIAPNATALVEPDLKSACKRYAAGFDDRRTVLACGKWMFFYETFGTSGVPASLPRMLLQAFAEEMGPGFSKLGLYEDPRSREHLPYGMAPGKPIGLSPSIGFTCASCHMAKLPDGRFVVGAPNHDYRYGAQILAMTVFPFVAMSGPKAHASEAVTVLQPMLDHLKKDPKIWMKLGGAMMKALVAFKIPKLAPDIERAYATWPAGTLDFAIAPLAVDDEVEVVSKIPPIFDLPSADEMRETHMTHEMLGATGSTRTMLSFMHGFISLGGGDPKKWPEQKLRPLIEYLYTLRAPQNPHRAAPAVIEVGRAVFVDKGCGSCHNGAGHGGRRIYSFDEIGTDASLAHWLDARHEGTPCCDVKLEDPLSHGLKVPRLVGLWMQRRFLHNGSLSSLEQLFCLEPRPQRDAPLGTQGHRQTCDGLSTEEKHALIGYLRSL